MAALFREVTGNIYIYIYIYICVCAMNRIVNWNISGYVYIHAYTCMHTNININSEAHRQTDRQICMYACILCITRINILFYLIVLTVNSIYLILYALLLLFLGLCDGWLRASL